MTGAPLRLWAWLGAIIATWAVGFGALRLTVAQPEYCPPFDQAIAEASIDGAISWFDAAILPNGQYVYEYNREGDTIPPGYNLVRHAGVTMSIYQLAAERGDMSGMETADAALGFMLDNLMRDGDLIAFVEGRNSAQLGAASLMLVGLNLRRDGTGDTQYDDVMRGLGHFLIAMQREDGSFLAFWDQNTGAPVPDVTSKYATGEAFWGLAQLHRIFPDEGWDEPARLVATYLATERDEDEGFNFPPWADQWASYGLWEMAGWPEAGLTEEHVAYARSLAERFGFLIRVESRRGEDDPLEFINLRRTRGAGMGTWIEASTSLYRLSLLEPRLADLSDDLADRSVCGAGMLADRQVSAEEAAGEPRPQLVEGAWFTDGITRMDDQQHALSGVLRTIPILEARESQ